MKAQRRSVLGRIGERLLPPLRNTRANAACRRRPASCRPALELLEGRTLLSFTAAPGYAVGAFPRAAVGDFNGDGVPALVVANANDQSVSVLLGRGDGSFLPAQSYTAGLGPKSVAVGDFNGDGAADLAVTDFSGVALLLGNGDGTFQ